MSTRSNRIVKRRIVRAMVAAMSAPGGTCTAISGFLPRFDLTCQSDAWFGRSVDAAQWPKPGARAANQAGFIQLPEKLEGPLRLHPQRVRDLQDRRGELVR